MTKYLGELEDEDEERYVQQERGLSMEEVEDDEQHIEMNLGLGVLEENREEDASSSGDNSDAEDEDEDKVGQSKDVPASSDKQSDGSRKKDAMCELLGRSNGQQKAGLEEVG